MAEQLNILEVILHVIGSSSLVWEAMVQFFDDQLSLLGQDSVIDMLPGIRKVNVWNRGLSEGTAVALFF